jgi:DNA-directed RNA polymerase specialized sigma24 family protein
MANESIPSNDSRILLKPIPAEAHAFNRRVSGLLDGQPKDEATVAQALEGMDSIVDQIATGLYSLASMLAGEGEDSVRLVETAVANTEVSACQDPEQARKSSRRALCEAALKTLAERNSGCLAAPEGLEPAETCIEDDDLEAAGVSGEELERMIAGPDRDRVRKWLASLPTGLRTVFVLRAVAGFSAAETAGLLKADGGPKAAGWNVDAVRVVFRQGLCSLASQLLQASAASR